MSSSEDQNPSRKGNSGDNEDQNPSRKGNSDQNSPRKGGKGRRKVAMEKMEKKANLQVTFSKRRNNIFKKAGELSTRCGAEAALVIYSPGGKPFSFGHPNVETVASRFLGEADQNSPQTAQQAEDERHMMLDAHAELNRTMNRLDIARNKAKELEPVHKQVSKGNRVKEFDYDQLDKLKREVLDFKDKFENEEGRDDQSFTPFTFLGPSPNLGPTGSSFDSEFRMNPEGVLGINIFGNHIPYVPHSAGASSSVNFLEPPVYPMWNDNSGVVFPYTPSATNPTGTIPVDPAEDEPSLQGTGNNADDASKNGDE